jgi:hypothetical protein
MMPYQYKQTELTVIKCIGCDKTCIYDKQYSNDYCMNCINRLNHNIYKREAFKRMLEGVKRNVIKTHIKYEYYDENEECDSYNTMEIIDDYNLFINTPQSSYSDDPDDSDDSDVFIQYSNNEESEGLIKSSFKSLVNSFKTIFNSLTKCSDKQYKKQSIKERKEITRQWINEGAHIGDKLWDEL